MVTISPHFPSKLRRHVFDDVSAERSEVKGINETAVGVNIGLSVWVRVNIGLLGVSWM